MAAFFQRFIGSFALLAMTVSLHAQSLQQRADDWSSKSRREAEDTVANKINAVRASANLRPLKRATPALREVELVCTAAVTGRKEGDPIFSGLGTYVTADLSAENEAIKVVALGSEACRGKPPSCSEGNHVASLTLTGSGQDIPSSLSETQAALPKTPYTRSGLHVGQVHSKSFSHLLSLMSPSRA